MVVAKIKQPLNQGLGPMTTITTAPVAIGNSIKGVASQVIRTADGVVVRGREFMFPAVGTGSVTTWTLCGGAPLTPAAFSDSVISSYMRMYGKFKFVGAVATYITSSPTTSNGDVLFYYSKNRESVFLSQTSPNLLPMVLSDGNTVMGPQWTNHSTKLNLKGTWKSTDYGMHSGIEDYAEGELFLLSKTSTTDSPGYVIFDYQIAFQEMQISPRYLSFPMPKILWKASCFRLTTSGVVAGTAIQVFTGGNDITGAAASNPTGLANGDVYKVIIDLTNSATWTNVTPSQFRVNENAGYAPLTIVDGTTLYAVYNDTTWTLYPNAETAFTCSITGAISWGVTATVTVYFVNWLSYVGSVGTTNINPNF